MIGILMEEDSAFDKALRKADDIHMTVNGNPLRKDPDMHCCLVHKNMDRLHDDARAWSDQRTGEAYRAIRGMTLNQGE